MNHSCPEKSRGRPYLANINFWNTEHWKLSKILKFCIYVIIKYYTTDVFDLVNRREQYTLVPICLHMAKVCYIFVSAEVL